MIKLRNGFPAALFCSFQSRRILMARVTMHTRDDVVSGIWKFKALDHEAETSDDEPQGVRIEDLLEVAEQWLHTEGDKYLDVFIRKCSSDQWGICFQYIFAGKNHQRYFHKTSDKLKRRFGNDFVGWDISAPTHLIKKSGTKTGEVK